MSTSDSLTTSSMDDHEMHDYVFRIAPISIPPIEVIEKNNNVDDIVLDQIASPPASPGFEPSACVPSYYFFLAFYEECRVEKYAI